MTTDESSRRERIAGSDWPSDDGIKPPGHARSCRTVAYAIRAWDICHHTTPHHTMGWIFDAVLVDVWMSPVLASAGPANKILLWVISPTKADSKPERSPNDLAVRAGGRAAGGWQVVHDNQCF